VPVVPTKKVEAAVAAVPGGDEQVMPAPEETGALRTNGTTVRVRPIRPDDAAALRAFHAGLSAESIMLRFFSAHPRLSDAEVERFTHVDGVDRLALVAEDGTGIVAVARFDRTPGLDEAEVAFVVGDAFQGHGLGSLLLQRLADEARARGVRWLVADTLAENFRMLHVFRDAGFPRTLTRTSEVVRVVMDIGDRPG
jgi:GNAT superfamily N-acetyltransferase